MVGTSFFDYFTCDANNSWKRSFYFHSCLLYDFSAAFGSPAFSFGSPSTSSAPNTFGGFGSAPATTNTGFGAFGSTPATTNTNFGAFGTTPATTNTGFGGFGTPAASTAGVNHFFTVRVFVLVCHNV